jgi:hypothetical protein
MLTIGERVECVDKKSTHFGEKGNFIGWVANGFKVKFDNGKEDLFLACDLKTLNSQEDKIIEKIVKTDDEVIIYLKNGERLNYLAVVDDLGSPKLIES